MSTIYEIGNCFEQEIVYRHISRQVLGPFRILTISRNKESDIFWKVEVRHSEIYTIVSGSVNVYKTGTLDVTEH